VTVSHSTITLEQALTDLPAKLRVHELAKRAGITSKDVITALAQAGVVVAAAASSVGAMEASAMLTALLGVPQAIVPAPAVIESAPVQPDFAQATVKSRPAQDPGFFASPLFLPPVQAKPPGRRRSVKAEDQADTTLVFGEQQSAQPIGTRATKAKKQPHSGAVDPFETVEIPVVVAAVEVEVGAETEEVGTSRSGRRRRGRAGGRARTEQTDDESGVAAQIGDHAVGAPGSAGEAVVEQPQPDAERNLASSDEDDEADQAARRRRRRGRRGRGRTGTEGQDEQGEAALADADQENDADGDEAAVDGESADSGDSEDTEAGEEAGTRRRRRRRRRTGSSEGGAQDADRDDDPDNTVVHVREPRSEKAVAAGGTSASEVQGVRGSTRLEAKRQRRRDARGSRSRPQILTEAEFLARRESVERVMAVRQRGDLAQVALLEDGVLVEHFVSLAGAESLMGNIYLGKVQNVLPSMEAAFVDIGKGRNAVLYAGEVNWDAAGLAGKARRIETALTGGDTLLVQISKDPVGHKGARLTTQISLPGRFLVYVPGGGATGISRKLPDTERKRLKAILDRIVPEDAGVIIRTAAEGVAEEELALDVERLKSQWEEISRQAQKKANAPLLLSAEPDTLIKVVRDLFNSDITRLVLDGERAYEPVAAYIGAVAPELANRVSKYDGPNDVFAAYRIDEQIAKALERKVYLPSGGSLVIDRTEAMTVVDVNTGKYTGSGGNLEETVTKNNLEAAEEVVRQLRLRDIGGIIVVDFIDMVLESNRELVMRRLTECLGRDRTRHQVAEVTSLGLIQMTRKKMGTGLVEAFSEPCTHCQGRGIILHNVPVQDQLIGQDVIGDTDARSGRNRRGRVRQDSQGIELPVPDIAAAVVRPPDPRGPKPPIRSDEPGFDTSDPVEVRPDVSRKSTSRKSTKSVAATALASTASDASFNAPRSRDAADAVSAVLASLDARAERQAAEQPLIRAAVRHEPDHPEPDHAEPPTPAPRRGRRAAGRPAGAPMSSAAGTPEVSVSILAVPPVLGAVVSDVSGQLDGQAQIVEEGSEAVQARKVRAPARRRGAKVASAPMTTTEPVGIGAAVADGAAAQPEAAAPAVSAAQPGVESAAVVDAPAKAAPRRRRAASRPAGPATAL